MSSEKTVDNWHDPNSMAPRSSALWEWYKNLSARLYDLANCFADIENEYGYYAIKKIADEIDEHAAEMEYQCRI